MDRSAEIMGNSGSSTHRYHSPQILTVGVKVLLSAIIVSFLLVAFVLFMHLYANWLLNRRRGRSLGPHTRSRRGRFVFAPTQGPLSIRPGRGLEASVFRSLPVLTFRSHEFKDGLECAVCLCDVSEGERARLLPRCNHGFHVDCIDMWLKSHTTCPLCRSPVAPASTSEPNCSHDQSSQAQEEGNSNIDIDGSAVEMESQNPLTNVAFQGNHTDHELRRVGSDHERPVTSSSLSHSRVDIGTLTLAIEIPTQLAEDFAAVPLSPCASGSAADEECNKSPTTPRFRPLRRLLSRGKRVTTPRTPPHVVDVERDQEGRDQ